MIDEELFSHIRSLHDALKLIHDAGLARKIDKKLFRFNDIATVARRYEPKARA